MFVSVLKFLLSSKENLTGNSVKDADGWFPLIAFGAATWLLNLLSIKGVVHNLNSINEPLSGAPNSALPLPPINRWPLPDQLPL